ncbi:MAG UNVERIFIED_CONTAM: hypothetical protein LVT10_21300 [Anaerolineae bacterium]
MYRSSLVVAVVSLIVLALTVLNENFGLVVVQYEIDPATLTDGEPLESFGQKPTGRNPATERAPSCFGVGA